MTPLTGHPVHIENFRMEFGGTAVVNDLSFDVQRGETFGFLGSNGSGKTTTLRALLGIYKPTAGVLHIDGRPFTPETGPRLGYLPEERGLYKKESVIDVMTYFGRLKGLGRKASAEWSVNYLERIGLGDKGRTRVEKLSGEEQQKTNGATVLMVTHQMEEVERLCDRVILLKDGRAEAYGTVPEVQNQYGGTMIRLGYSGEVPPSPHYEISTLTRNYAELTLADSVDEALILRGLVTAGVLVRSFTTSKLSLEEIFVQVYGEQTMKAGV